MQALTLSAEKKYRFHGRKYENKKKIIKIFGVCRIFTGVYSYGISIANEYTLTWPHWSGDSQTNLIASIEL